MPAYPHIYLASRSPRRRELLQQIGVPFTELLLREHAGREADVNEDALPGEDPDAYVRRVCELKAATGWQRMLDRRIEPRPVLASDTTVTIDGLILGKPADAADAARMLRLLSGREHRVLTAVAIQSQSGRQMAVSDSTVRFRRLDEAHIAGYVACGEAFGKAGAYGIQGQAAAFVSVLHGSYSGVMGLPLCEASQMLELISP